MNFNEFYEGKEFEAYKYLGAHVTEEGILIQVFLPQAKNVWVKNTKTGKEYDMYLEDENGFFAVYLPGKKKTEYTLLLEEGNIVC